MSDRRQHIGAVAARFKGRTLRFVHAKGQAASDDREYIGASEVPAVLGAHRFSTGFDVWARKVHDVEKPMSPVSRLMCAMGNAAEPFIFEMFAADNPDAVRGPPYGTPGIPYKRVRARPDFLLPRATGDIKLVFESGPQWGTVDEPCIPSDYLPQLLAQAACARASGRTVDEVLLVSLHLDRHSALQVQRLPLDADWWDAAEEIVEWVTAWHTAFVTTGRQPPPRKTQALHGVPAERLPFREATAEERALIETLQQLRLQRAFLDASLVDVRAQLRASMADTKRLTVGGLRAATLSEGTVSRLDPDLVRAIDPGLARRCAVTAPSSTLTVTRRPLGHTDHDTDTEEP